LLSCSFSTCPCSASLALCTAASLTWASLPDCCSCSLACLRTSASSRAADAFRSAMLSALALPSCCLHTQKHPLMHNAGWCCCCLQIFVIHSAYPRAADVNVSTGLTLLPEHPRASGPPLAGVPLYIAASAILVPVCMRLPDQASQTLSICCGAGIVILSFG